MERYFDARDSAKWLYGEDAESIIRLTAARYMGENPAAPFVWRAFDEQNFPCDQKGVYRFDLEARFPYGENGEHCVIIGELYCPADKSSNFVVRCFSPTVIRINGETVFASNGAQERQSQPCTFSARLRKGCNRFVIRCERTALGFGCALGNAMPQWEPCCFVQPFEQRQGEAGFVWTEPLTDEDEISEDALWGEDETALCQPLLPAQDAPLLDDDAPYYGWSELCLRESRRVSWHVPDGLRVWVDGEPIADAPLAGGRHTVLSFGRPADIFALRPTNTGLSMSCPLTVHGRHASALLMGPFEAPVEGFAPRAGQVENGLVWQTGYRGVALRPYAEQALFGRWTYPLGVTLRGMLNAGELFDDAAMLRYVRAHVGAVAQMDAYALYDTEKYGFAGVNQQLCWLDALDDCGSFGALQLACDPRMEHADIRSIARRIARYMRFEQPRTPQGAFCRRDDTVWADDMYMSVPFLCFYAKAAGEAWPLEEASKQMLLYRDMLFMPQKRLMAHMRCLRADRNNAIPWSRGNGWVIFALSELLLCSADAVPDRDELLRFFRELTRGYCEVQGATGLWHQILDDDTTYPEASATAMMICAFSRGIANGWYDDEALQSIARSAAYRAWRGLCETAIDKSGNLYGVCRGSGFSFSRAYYKTLSWNFNDTHGIGIVMLAGTELLKTERA